MAVGRLLTGPDEPRTAVPGFDTPEGAVLMLEEAYRVRDLEAAVRCKDFAAEARLLLRHQAPALSHDPGLVRETAEILEASFRKHTVETWPDFLGVTSRFMQRYHDTPEFVVVREECTLPDGTKVRTRLNVARGPDGWRVLNPC